MDYNIHYIVCFYLGHRRSVKFNNIIDNDQTYFLRKHLEFLQTCGTEITEATFVVNGDVPKEFAEYALQNAPKNVKINVAGRKNHGFSYGAWNDVIADNIRRENRHNYYFMIEDDYLPCRPDFYKPFVEKCTDETPFVCCKVSPSNIDSKGHPAISNGIIQGKACEYMLLKWDHIFHILEERLCNNSYDNAYLIQTYYFIHFEREGFGFTDVAEEYCFPFHESINDTISYHGNTNGERLILPLL